MYVYALSKYIKYQNRETLLCAFMYQCRLKKRKKKKERYKKYNKHFFFITYICLEQGSIE